MKQLTSALALSLVLAAGWAAPAAAADKEQRQMMADIRMLQEQAQQLQNMVTALTEAIKTVDTRLTTRLDQQTDVTQKAMADQKTVITSISNDLRSVREKLDDNTTRVGSLTLEVQTLRQFVAASRTAVATPDAPADITPPSSTAGAQAGASPATLGASPQAIFDHAYSDYTANQWDLAIDGFQDLIKSFPTSPLADDAQVNICNAYLTDGKYDKAVEACDAAIRNYPAGTATARAYYYKGTALRDLKQADRARDAFAAVVKSFPDSQEATLAQQRLDELKDPKKP